MSVDKILHGERCLPSAPAKTMPTSGFCLCIPLAMAKMHRRTGRRELFRVAAANLYRPLLVSGTSKHSSPKGRAKRASSSTATQLQS